jgi:hypothetical protein
MAAVKYDFTIEQGATTIKPFVWKSGEDVPVNLTGATVRMQVRRSTSSSDVLLEASTANSRIQLDPLLGKFTLVLSATVTAAISWLTGVYDIEITASNGVVTRLVQGTITVSKEVTRD